MNTRPVRSSTLVRLKADTTYCSRPCAAYVVSGFSRTTLVAIAVATIACSSPAPEQRPADPAPRAEPRTITLPDLAKLDPAVRTRIQDRHASVTAVPGAAGYGELGKLLMAAQLLTDAETAFLNAQALAPTDRRWPYYLAHVQRLQQAPDEATTYFEQARTLQPDDVPTLVWLGRLYVDQGRPETAAPLLERAVALQPRSAAALFELGRAAIARRDFLQATTHLQAALRVDPGAVQAHYPLAMAQRALGRSAEADAHLKLWKDVELLPADPLLEEIGALLGTAIDHEVRGTRAMDRRDWPNAIAAFRAGLERAPSDPSLYLNLGTALYLSGDLAQAQSAFERAIELSPGYARAHFTLGVLHAGRGRADAAIERLTAAVAYDPALVDARFSLAEMLRGSGRVEASLPHYLAVVSADPNSSQARFGYAMALVRLERYREAREALSDAVRAHGQQPGLVHALGRLLAAAPDPQVRDGAQALRLLEPLSSQSPSSTIAESMAMALAETGRYAGAARWQRDAIARAGREGGAAAAARLQDNLRLYEGGLPCRTPWRADDPVFRPSLARGL
ncbi:MAG: tetratricopeptide repeat protein [Acidimicrobiia bacterium]|nr:tetratricopeptide repeat protein [Acidimicrobiia bacterium]